MEGVVVGCRLPAEAARDCDVGFSGWAYAVCVSAYVVVDAVGLDDAVVSSGDGQPGGACGVEWAWGVGREQCAVGVGEFVQEDDAQPAVCVGLFYDEAALEFALAEDGV